MRDRLGWGLGVALLCASCAGVATPPVDVAVLPPGASGGQDPDMAAIGQAADAFSGPQQTYGRPVEAARAAAAVEYLGGALNAAPRWACLSGVARTQILQARVALRAALGVAPGTPSQRVVDDLVRAAEALSENDTAGAAAALGPPAFAAAPADTLRLLGNLPYLPVVNVATQRVEGEATSAMFGSTCYGES